MNIVKDVAADFERGDCFIPENLAAAHDVDLCVLLDPAHRARAMAVIREICARARRHLARAVEYTALWPVPAGEPVRLFCAVPLALATLCHVEQTEDVLQPGHIPKVSRDTVAQIVTDAHQAARRNDVLTAMMARYGPPPLPLISSFPHLAAQPTGGDADDLDRAAGRAFSYQ